MTSISYRSLKNTIFTLNAFAVGASHPALLLNHDISLILHPRTKASSERVTFSLFSESHLALTALCVCVIVAALWSPEIKSVQAFLYAQFFFLMTRVLLFVFILSIRGRGCHDDGMTLLPLCPSWNRSPSWRSDFSSACLPSQFCNSASLQRTDAGETILVLSWSCLEFERNCVPALLGVESRLWTGFGSQLIMMLLQQILFPTLFQKWGLSFFLVFF